jgi:hypothetical protein
MRTKPNSEENISPAIICNAPWRLIKIKPLDDYILEAEFVDGTHGFVNLKQLVTNPRSGVFVKLADVNVFNKVYVDYGVATWPEGIDLAPDNMYNEIKNNGTWIL